MQALTHTICPRIWEVRYNDTDRLQHAIMTSCSFYGTHARACAPIGSALACYPMPTSLPGSEIGTQDTIITAGVDRLRNIAVYPSSNTTNSTTGTTVTFWEPGFPDYDPRFAASVVSVCPQTTTLALICPANPGRANKGYCGIDVIFCFWSDTRD